MYLIRSGICMCRFTYMYLYVFLHMLTPHPTWPVGRAMHRSALGKIPAQLSGALRIASVTAKEFLNCNILSL